jgi:hypothetical protein
MRDKQKAGPQVCNHMADPIPSLGVVATFARFLGLASHYVKKQSWFWVSEVRPTKNKLRRVWKCLGWVTSNLGLCVLSAMICLVVGSVFEEMLTTWMEIPVSFFTLSRFL